MTNNLRSPEMGTLQKSLLLIVGLTLAVLIFFLRGGMSARSPLDQLARQSIDPVAAISNGRPTVFEFYADWCEVCRKMAPAMITLDNKYADQVDIVMLNIDNAIWNDLINKYNVQGIPKLIFFDSNGDKKGSSLGFRDKYQIEQIFDSLLKGKSFPEYTSMIKVSNLEDIEPGQNKLSDSIENIPISPRDHGRVIE